MSAHTPGPWRYDLDKRGRHVIVPGEHNGPLAQVFARVADPDGYPARENATLISAAPDLLGACRDAGRFLRVDHDALAPLIRANPELSRCLASTVSGLHAAIEKAGEV